MCMVPKNEISMILGGLPGLELKIVQKIPPNSYIFLEFLQKNGNSWIKFITKLNKHNFGISF